MKEEESQKKKPVRKPAKAKRFNLFHRFVHLTITLGVIGAALTGFPLKFKDIYGMKWFVAQMGGVETMGIIHRICAISIISYIVFQGAYMFYYIAASKLGAETGALTWILPRKRETLDIKANALYLIGRRPEPSFRKFVYWGWFDWLVAIAALFAAVISGLVVWFPTFFVQWIPGTWLNAAYVIHSNGAVLIVVIILVTHFYNIYWSTGHISDCLVIFTGRMTARRKKLT